MQTTQNARTESLHILVNPEIKEKAEWVYQARGLTLEDVINNLLEEDSKNDYLSFCNGEEADEILREFEDLINDKNKKVFNNAKELRADCLSENDD